ncbi:MAG: TlpA family protein disulfide reductase [Alphaproteobacteria bacterium]|nr:TlpA family protein disulfide reductase [Alphaproteobacteria bacterium]MCB9791618.1 TlpA family protein disulfide reductase [Alphaproteobacteria bacterium]
MGRLRNLAKRVAERVARRAAQDELFEKPGERAPTPPLAAPEAEDDEEPQPAGPRVRAADSAALLEAMRPDGRLLIVHHWATWCAPCEEELPAIQALFEELGARGRLLGVSWDAFEGGDPEQLAPEVADYAQRLGVSWPSLLVSDAPEDFFEALGLEFQRIPQTWVFDGAGELALRVDGVMEAGHLERARALMG